MSYTLHTMSYNLHGKCSHRSHFAAALSKTDFRSALKSVPWKSNSTDHGVLPGMREDSVHTSKEHSQELMSHEIACSFASTTHELNMEARDDTSWYDFNLRQTLTYEGKQNSG